jgi:long-chain acyl-CoA synthetase
MEKTINQVFRNRADKYRDRLAIEKKKQGKWEQETGNAYYANARATGIALLAFGLEKGDRVSLLSENCLEWLYTDMGVLGAGGCVAPIYPTLTDDEVAFIGNHSDSKFLFVENAQQLKKGLFAAEKSTALKKIILFNDEGIEKNNPLIIKFSDLLEIGAKEYHNNHDLFEKTGFRLSTE